jgi:hypothetical protein
MNWKGFEGGGLDLIEALPHFPGGEENLRNKGIGIRMWLSRQVRQEYFKYTKILQCKI